MPGLRLLRKKETVFRHTQLIHRIRCNICKTVFSEFCHHHNIRACLVRRNALIKSFSSRSHLEHRTFHRLSRYRKMRTSCHQIDYKSYQNTTTLPIFFSSCLAPSLLSSVFLFITDKICETFYKTAFIFSNLTIALLFPIVNLFYFFGDQNVNFTIFFIYF